MIEDIYETDGRGIIINKKKEKSKRSPVEQRVIHPCQQLRDTGNICRSGKRAKRYKVFGDAEMYRGLWLKVYLCPRCAKEAGV